MEEKMLVRKSDASENAREIERSKYTLEVITEVKPLRPKELEEAKFGANFSQSKILVNTASPEQHTQTHSLSHSENAAPKVYTLLFSETLAGKQRLRCRKCARQPASSAVYGKEREA